MPRWYVWIAGVIALRAIGENVSVAAAVALAAAALVGYWGYRLATAPNLGETRWRAGRRELRRIGLEVGDAVLGWVLIVLLVVAVVGIVVTWPPGWTLIAIVLLLAMAVPIAFIASVVGVTNVLDRVRGRRWEARARQLEDVLSTWERHALSTRAADHALVERVVRDVYGRRRGLTRPEVQWAGSPPEFARLLDAAADRPRLEKPPPQWFSLLRLDVGYYVWNSISMLAGQGRDDDREDGGVLPASEFEAALGAAAGTPDLAPLVEQTAWFSFRTGLAIVLERPTVIRLEDDELHNPLGPAVRFPDGWEGWALEGVPVPPEAIRDPERFDPHVALTHPNVEVRRVLLAHLGWDRVVAASGLAPDVQDEHGRLWRLPVPDREAVLLLEVENATAEADGTRRRYFLRVPPDMRSPREASAWTFGLDEDEYAPSVET